VARNWLSIRVELVSGCGVEYWPWPGRVFAASRTHSFGQLADAIDTAFARWDLAHLHMFTLADGTEVTGLDEWGADAPDGCVDSAKATLDRLAPGEQFAYLFDIGEDWSHLCTVAARRVDPRDELGFVPQQPVPYFGWGDLPDQYGRSWDSDDGRSRQPKRPANPLTALPPLLPWWGPLRGRR
jgi:hypothetical protein